MATSSTPPYLEGLNPAQLEAVLHDEGPLLILAVRKVLPTSRMVTMLRSAGEVAGRPRVVLHFEV